MKRIGTDKENQGEDFIEGEALDFSLQSEEDLTPQEGPYYHAEDD